ncbi:MAG: hypothetical protein WD770_02260 [Actinomycetota bacterium]
MGSRYPWSLGPRRIVIVTLLLVVGVVAFIASFALVVVAARPLSADGSWDVVPAVTGFALLGITGLAALALARIWRN